MPNWLQSIIPGDAAKTVGIEWSPGESERLARVLRAKTGRHHRKFDQKTLRGIGDMKHKENVLEALKSGPMTVEQLVEKTGIKQTVLYTVVSDLANLGTINKENIDGGRGRRYSLADHKNDTPRYAVPAATAPKKLPAGPVVEKKAERPVTLSPSLGMFKPGDKFVIVRHARHISVLATTLGMVTIGTGEQIQINAEESANARPIVRLRAEVVQAVDI